LYDDVGTLTVYRRHNPALCKSTDRYYKRCTCPTWVEGMVGDKVRKMDATEDPTPAPAKKDEPITIERAVNEYLADAKARELGEATLYKLNIIFRKQLLA
jgi:integrase/recombinase XerD